MPMGRILKRPFPLPPADELHFIGPPSRQRLPNTQTCTPTNTRTVNKDDRRCPRGAAPERLAPLGGASLHTKTCVHTVRGKQPGAEVVAQIAPDSLDGLLITTRLGVTPGEGCTNIQQSG